jgi:chemotaxis signal transduction protein
MSAPEPRSVWEQRLLEDRARALAAPRTPHVAASQEIERVIVCALGDALFGVGVHDVMRVTPFRRPARLPGPDATLLGLSARSGVYYRIYDLTALLQNAPGPQSGYFLLLRLGGRGFRVDEALGVADVTPLGADEAPQNMAAQAATRGYARPVHAGSFDGRLITLLNLSKLFADATPSAHGGHPSVDL